MSNFAKIKNNITHQNSDFGHQISDLLKTSALSPQTSYTLTKARLLSHQPSALGHQTS